MFFRLVIAVIVVAYIGVWAYWLRDIPPRYSGQFIGLFILGAIAVGLSIAKIGRAD